MKTFNIRIILVNTKNPGNIGSTARAIKTMGLNQLYLVQPKSFPSDQAFTLAAGADDILNNAVITETLEKAILDCTLVIGTSTRSRGISLPMLTPEEGANKIVQQSKNKTCAIVFGREDRGLTNDELQLCSHQIQIPSIESFSSLNLASSVQIIAYELRKHILKAINENIIQDKNTKPIPSIKEVEFFYNHLESLLNQIDFFKNSSQKNIMYKLRRLYNRANIDKKELSILCGIITETKRNIAQNNS